MTEGSLGRNLFRLAAPVAASMALGNLYAVVDAFWLGQEGKLALQAPGVSLPFIFVVIAMGFGLGSAGTALVSQHTGAKNEREADRAAAQVILLTTAIAAMLAVPMIVFAPQLLRLARVPEAVIPGATVYLRIFMLGAPLMAFTMGYGGALRAVGDTLTMVVVSGAANVLNIVLDPALIRGWGAVPALGVAGAALASVFCTGLSAVACVMLIRRGHSGLRLAWGDFRPDWRMLRQLFSIGAPAAVGMGCNSLGFLFFQVMINKLGQDVISAFTIGFRVIHFFSIPAHCMAMAAAPVVGQALGAGKRALARRAVWVSTMLVAGVMVLPYGALMWQGRWVAWAFVKDAAVCAEAGRLFMIVPASSYCFGVLMVLMSAHSGAGHTRPMMMLSLLRQIGLRLPVAWVLGFVLGYGSTGVYMGLVAGNVVSAVIALWLFLGRGWERSVLETGD